MSFEIVYTSVRRGLRTGSKGFCTVAATAGIPRALQEKLESLSGYSHHEAAAGSEPPVNYSHVIVRIQRKVYHVLSRVADAGKDYSGRTNKIAHHLALTSAEAERYPDGPVSLFSDDTFWFESWDDEPEELPPNRLPDPAFCAPDDFDTWQSVFGDAGWAGIPGQGVADGLKPVTVIVPHAQDSIELLSEAMQLVPRERRWELCFSTYFSRQAPGTECHWKFVLDRTQEARRLRARSAGQIVDCASARASLPLDNPFVEAARAGRAQDAHELLAEKKRRRAVIPEDRGFGNGSGRRTGRRRRSEPPARRPTRTRSPFEFDEDEHIEDAEEVTDESRGRRLRLPPRMGLWIVLVLFLGVGAVLVFFVMQQLS